MPTSNTGPVPWHTPRTIDGQPGYTWHYHSDGSDLRVVMRPEPDAMPRTTLVGDVRLARSDDGCCGEPDELRAYDLRGVMLGHETGEGSLARATALVAQADRATQLGATAARNRAELAFDPTATPDTYAQCIQLDGEPEWWDQFGPGGSPLSGEFAGDPTPASLMTQLGVTPDLDPDGEWEAELCDRYERAFSDAWHHRVMTIAREHAPPKA